MQLELQGDVTLTYPSSQHPFQRTENFQQKNSSLQDDEKITF